MIDDVTSVLNRSAELWYTSVMMAPTGELHNVQRVYEACARQFRVASREERPAAAAELAQLEAPAGG